jgi:hypothetical protein
MIRVYVSPGTVTGFTLQAEAGVLVSFSEHGFVHGHLTYQSSYLKNDTTSTTTGETATADLHTMYGGINGGVGYWF